MQGLVKVYVDVEAARLMLRGTAADVYNWVGAGMLQRVDKDGKTYIELDDDFFHLAVSRRTEDE